MKLLWVLGMLACTPPHVDHPRPPLSELESSVRELGTAWGSRDLVSLERLLATEYTHTDVSGLVLHRADWLEQVKARATTFTVAFDDVRVSPLGEGALATGANRITGADGQVLDLRFTQLWVVEGGHWRRRAFEATLIANPPHADYEAEVRAAAAAFSEVIQRRDVKAAELVLGAEYALMAPGSGETSRAKWLANLPDYIVHSYEFLDVKIQVYGETAVMRSRYKQAATVAGKDRSGEMLLTDVWVKRDHRWQIVARHTSFLG
jgi:ketosteroid isomerase-like protein